MIETPKAVYLRPVLEVRLVAELLTVPKKVMVCWVCMLFLLLPGQSGHIPKGAKVRCSQVAAWPRCQEKKFLERDPEPARGEESNTRRARYASSERRAEGRCSCTEAGAEGTCKQGKCPESIPSLAQSGSMVAKIW